MRFAFGFDTVAFRKTIVNNIDYDYGDFMRVTQYNINNLADVLDLLDDKNIKRILKKMQFYLVFDPTWNIQETKNNLNRDTNYIDELLLGHNQDWESGLLHA